MKRFQNLSTTYTSILKRPNQKNKRRKKTKKCCVLGTLRQSHFHFSFSFVLVPANSRCTSPHYFSIETSYRRLTNSNCVRSTHLLIGASLVFRVIKRSNCFFSFVFFFVPFISQFQRNFVNVNIHIKHNIYILYDLIEFHFKLP